MGSVIKKVRRVAAQALAIIAIIFVIWACVSWGGRVQVPDALAQVFEMVGIRGLTHWTLLALGAAAIFCAYVFDDEAASEMLGIPFRIAEDALKGVAKAAGGAVSGLLEGLNFTTLALAAGSVYVIGKVIEDDDNPEPSTNPTIVIGDDRSRQELQDEGDDVGPSGTGNILGERGDPETSQGRG